MDASHCFTEGGLSSQLDTLPSTPNYHDTLQDGQFAATSWLVLNYLVFRMLIEWSHGLVTIPTTLLLLRSFKWLLVQSKGVVHFLSTLKMISSLLKPSMHTSSWSWSRPHMHEEVLSVVFLLCGSTSFPRLGFFCQFIRTSAHSYSGRSFALQ